MRPDLDLVASLGLGASRRLLLWRAARWLAIQSAYVGAQQRWQAGWPRAAYPVLHELGLDAEDSDPTMWRMPAGEITGRFAAISSALRLTAAASELLAALTIAAVDTDLARVWHGLPIVPDAPPYTIGTWIEVLGDTSERRRDVLAVLGVNCPLN